MALMRGKRNALAKAPQAVEARCIQDMEGKATMPTAKTVDTRRSHGCHAILAMASLLSLATTAFAQSTNDQNTRGWAAPPATFGTTDAAPAGNEAIPDNFHPWWEGDVAQPVSPTAKPLTVGPQGLMLAAMEHSAQVRILRDSVFVKRSAIQEADGKFDARAFAESKFVATDDPVGSTLTTGGPNRWIDSNVIGSAGIRRTTQAGGTVEVSQQLGYEDSNSLYFVPPHQGTTRMAVSLTQPLLNGAGTAYNTSVVLLADINSNIARDQLSRDMQSLLLDLHKAYWDLYLQRVAVAQRLKLLQAGMSIRDNLVARRNVDVLRGQIARAQSAVANRRADLIRRQAAVKNAEARIRAIVNDPGLGSTETVELVPDTAPGRLKVQTNLPGSLVAALNSRPEIQQGMKEIRAASVRADVASNEVLPVLNAVLSSYVSGLRGYGDISGAYVDQFSAGRPSFTAGFQFEMPLGNRVANARLEQRRLEYRQATSQLEATTANIRAEVEIAVREVDTTYLEMVSKYHACVADNEDVVYQMSRWRTLPYEQPSAGFALDELLSAQDRLAQAELEFVSAEVGYNLAVICLTRATGTLVDSARLDQVLKCVSSTTISATSITGQPLESDLQNREDHVMPWLPKPTPVQPTPPVSPAPAPSTQMGPVNMQILPAPSPGPVQGDSSGLNRPTPAAPRPENSNFEPAVPTPNGVPMPIDPLERFQ
jgi:outer membrane protein TolC